MKILHIIPFLWNGAGKVLTDLCVTQQKHHEVMIVTSGESKGMSDWPVYRRRLSQHGILHRCVDFFDRDSAVYWKSVQQLSNLVSDYEPDVVHCHSGVPASAAAAIRDSGVASFRLISQLHSWETGRPEWMETMDIAGFRRSDLVIANTAAYRRILINAGMSARQIVSIPWGAAPEAMAVGVPVLAKCCPRDQDYPKGGRSAIALKPVPAEDVAESVGWALDHPDATRKLSAHAREMVELSFPWNRTVLEIETVYGIRENLGLA